MKAFVLRIRPTQKDRLEEALAADEIIIGWSRVKGLLDEKLSWTEFRQKVHDTCYADTEDYSTAGRAGGNLWRFIREMSRGDLVVVPHSDEFFVAEVTGEPRYVETRIDEDTAYRRSVTWLNGKRRRVKKVGRTATVVEE